MQRLTRPLLIALIAFLCGTSFLLGAYGGAVLVERDGTMVEMNDTLLRTALNLQVLDYIRSGNPAGAVNLILAMNDGNLLFLMHNDDLMSGDADFQKRKKTVITSLNREFGSHPRSRDSFQSDDEWRRFDDEINTYLKQ